VVLLGAGSVGAAVLTAAPQQTFRSVVDLIALDVQVVDGTGNPIGRIGPESFDVSIEGKKRTVVSADFVSHGSLAAGLEASGTGLVQEAADARTFVLAIDSGSFEAGSARPIMDGVRAFIDRLGPEDQLGLYAYPTETWIAPSTGRAQVRAALDHVVGERERLRSRFNLRASEVVDISAQTTNPNSFLTNSGRLTGAAAEVQAALDPVLRVARRECPDDPQCPMMIYNEGMLLAGQLQATADASLDGLDTLFHRLAELPGRKAIVLVSSGLLISDRLDGRPEVPLMAKTLGQLAARANAVVYTIQFDTEQPGMASSKGIGTPQLSRERAMAGNWLDNFSAEAGGLRIYVPTCCGTFAYDRVLRESSAHYLLGVQPEPADRDGKAHKVKVKVDRRGATVRSRQWVLIPVRH